MKSIRAELTLKLTGALVLLLGAGGAILYAKTKGGLELHEREVLEAKAFAVAAAIEVTNDKLQVELQPALAAEFSNSPRPSYYEVLNGEGRMLLRSPSFHANESLIEVPSAFARIALPDGRSGLAVAIDASADGEIAEDAHDHPEIKSDLASGLHVIVADDALDLEETLAMLRTTILAVFAASVVAAAFVVAFALRRGLAPLDRMAEQAQAIDVRSLSKRFTRGEVPRELEPIRDRLNDLLERLEQAFERESRFNSAVAHELRTPIAELRTTIEVAARWPDADEVPRVYADVLAIAVRMQRLVSALLALRRAESGAETLTFEPVVLREVVDREVNRLAAPAARRDLAIVAEVPGDLVLETHAELLASILDNWLANAVEYAPRGSHVRVQARRDGERFELTVANPAPGLGPDDLPFLFEPFWRKDAARSDRDHAGLGLALSRAVARALGLETAAELGEGSELRLVLRGPVRAADPLRVRGLSERPSAPRPITT